MLSAVLMAMILTAEWYFGTLHGGYYFPGRYEDAFGGMLRKFVVGIVVGMSISIWITKQERDRRP